MTRLLSVLAAVALVGMWAVPTSAADPKKDEAKKD